MEGEGDLRGTVGAVGAVEEQHGAVTGDEEDAPFVAPHRDHVEVVGQEVDVDGDGGCGVGSVLLVCWRFFGGVGFAVAGQQGVLVFGGVHGVERAVGGHDQEVGGVCDGGVGDQVVVVLAEVSGAGVGVGEECWVVEAEEFLGGSLGVCSAVVSRGVLFLVRRFRAGKVAEQVGVAGERVECVVGVVGVSERGGERCGAAAEGEEDGGGCGAGMQPCFAGEEDGEHRYNHGMGCGTGSRPAPAGMVS